MGAKKAKRFRKEIKAATIMNSEDVEDREGGIKVQ